jgi:hypothetical protein
MTGDDDCLVLALPLIGQEIPYFPPSIVAKLEMGMSDENENRSGQANRMDEAFCARMRAAIEAGLERAPIGVVTTPGTNNPKYVPTEHPCRLVSPLVDMDV